MFIFYCYSCSTAICKDIPNGAVHIEKSCVRYWLCVGGYPRLQRCPAGLAFNPTALRCELAQTVPGCEPPPTTPATEEDTAEEESPSSAGQDGPGGSSVTSSPSSTGRSIRPSLQQQPPLIQSQPQGPLPQPFRPSQPGVRLVGR